MKRKAYEKPVTQVVELQHQAQLLQASGNVQDYTVNPYYEE